MNYSSEDSLDNIALSTRFNKEPHPVNAETSIDNANTVVQARIFSKSSEPSSEASSPEGAPTESSISPAVNSSSPPSSPVPFVHWMVLDREIDLDWGEYEEELSEKDKDVLRKKNGKLACIGLQSVATQAEVDWSMKYYDQDGIWAIPHRHNRPHRFDKIKGHLGYQERF